MDGQFLLKIKAIFQLPFREIFYYFWYQFTLRSGILRLLTPKTSRNQSLVEKQISPDWIDILPDRNELLSDSAHSDEIISRANSILKGRYKFFGIVKSEIDLQPESPLNHWSAPETPPVGPHQKDIKFIWEPARFSWAMQLSQAYYLSSDERYADFFWEQFFKFTNNNPLNCGPNWQSAQEVALRLISLVISINFLKPAKASKTDRVAELCRYIADHADRIPPTLSYAKAQNNNHLISEAVGLYTAGTFLPHHPRAEKWKRIGKRWFDYAIVHQISESGEYIQHSTNYHRMMLMLGLWMWKLLGSNRSQLPEKAASRLKLATQWLIGQLDPESGQAPNLGHNDGSIIFPFSTANYHDYRPIIQAASSVFLGKTTLQHGPWDDLRIWMRFPSKPDKMPRTSFWINPSSPRIGNVDSWASLRVMKYQSRPAHADQLHVDLWYHGHNVALDAGTYQYNANPPWNNGLSQTLVHNTITINRKNQMTRSGRFLWLDWAQASIIDQNKKMIAAEHQGYRELGLMHKRILTKKSPTYWELVDTIYSISDNTGPFNVQLHWLLHDWPFKAFDSSLILSAPFGEMELKIIPDVTKNKSEFAIYREGKSVSNTRYEEPLLGWYSPTYGIKKPAISIIHRSKSKVPLTITSQFTFPKYNKI